MDTHRTLNSFAFVATNMFIVQSLQCLMLHFEFPWATNIALWVSWRYSYCTVAYLRVFILHCSSLGSTLWCIFSLATTQWQDVKYGYEVLHSFKLNLLNSHYVSYLAVLKVYFFDWGEPERAPHTAWTTTKITSNNTTLCKCIVWIPLSLESFLGNINICHLLRLAPQCCAFP